MLTIGTVVVMLGDFRLYSDNRITC